MKNPVRHSIFRVIPALVLSCSAFHVARADQTVHLRPPADDPSYDLQGEYVGTVTRGAQAKTVGLQVRVLGDKQMAGLIYQGGLPGQDGFQQKSTEVIGRRAGDLVLLSGTRAAYFVMPDLCRVVAPSGKVLGKLKRVHRSSPTLGAKPPADAISLFDGTDTSQFTVAEMSDAGLLKQGADLNPLYQDFDLHVEFRLPYMPDADSQARANSGIYLQSRYECQVLDSFGQLPVYNGCGAIYRFKKPDVNMCLPPLVWQTYDIRFTAPRFAADGSKLRNARITSWLNGIKIQDDVELADKTGAGKPEGPTPLPTRFQDHKDQVRFRNIWIIDRGLSGGNDFPPINPTEEVHESMWEEVDVPSDPEPSDPKPSVPKPTDPKPPVPKPSVPEPSEATETQDDPDTAIETGEAEMKDSADEGLESEAGGSEEDLERSGALRLGSRRRLS